MRFLASLILLLLTLTVSGQDQDNLEILSVILREQYKNEKPVVKDRGSQYLFLYCDKTNNNEEIFETVNQLKLPVETVRALRQTVTNDASPDSWQPELDAFFATEHGARFKTRINQCFSLEQYNERRARLNLNNQRLMILYKPLYFNGGHSALLKQVFYRSIEHNSGCVLLLEKNADGTWRIKEKLNNWST